MKNSLILAAISFGIVAALICFSLLAVSLKSMPILLLTFVVGFFLTLGSLHISKLTDTAEQEYK